MTTKASTHLNYPEALDEIKKDIKEILNRLDNRGFARSKSESEADNTNDAGVKEAHIDREGSQNDASFPYSELLDKVKNNETLRKIFLGESSEYDHEKEKIVLIVKASQWENILQAWDNLLTKCKEKNCKAEECEIKVIVDCLELHNYRWTEKKAALVYADNSESYDYRKHQRVNHVNHVGGVH